MVDLGHHVVSQSGIRYNELQSVKGPVLVICCLGYVTCYSQSYVTVWVVTSLGYVTVWVVSQSGLCHSLGKRTSRLHYLWEYVLSVVWSHVLARDR